MTNFKIVLFLLLFFTSCATNAAPTPDQTLLADHTFLVAFDRPVWEADFPDVEGDTAIFLIDGDGELIRPVVTGLADRVMPLRLSPDEAHLLFATYPRTSTTRTPVGQLFLADMATGATTLITSQYPHPIRVGGGVFWLDNQQVLFVAGPPGEATIRRYQLADGAIDDLPALNAIYRPLPACCLLAFSEDGLLYWQDGGWEDETVAVGVFPQAARLDGSAYVRLQTTDNTKIPWSIAPNGVAVIWGNAVLSPALESVGDLGSAGDLQQSYWSADSRWLLFQVCADSTCDTTKLKVWEYDAPTIRGLDYDLAFTDAQWSSDNETILLKLGERPATPAGDSFLYDEEAQTAAYHLLSRADGAWEPAFTARAAYELAGAHIIWGPGQ